FAYPIHYPRLVIFLFLSRITHDATHLNSTLFPQTSPPPPPAPPQRIQRHTGKLSLYSPSRRRSCPFLRRPRARKAANSVSACKARMPTMILVALSCQTGNPRAVPVEKKLNRSPAWESCQIASSTPAPALPESTAQIISAR